MIPLVPYEFDAERFSRWMSYVLRHNPTRYGLQPDRHGYVDLEVFFLIAKRRYPDVAAEQLRTLIEAGGSGRFEISDTRLRARYGHSIPVEPVGAPVEPPERLYHGVDATRIETILQEGLKPTDRQMLHLSDTLDDVLTIARRKTSQPAILRILAREAYASGILFYHEGKIYLVGSIPPQFLILETPAEEAPTRQSA